MAVTNNGFVLQWVRPERPNGRISGYRVYYSSDNFTSVRTINSSEPVVSGEVDGLGKFKFLGTQPFCDKINNFSHWIFIIFKLII